MFLDRFGQRARLDSFGNFTENTLARIALTRPLAVSSPSAPQPSLTGFHHR